MNNNDICFSTSTIFTISEPVYKTQMKLGNLTINITKHLNWFQKTMWKICFGFDEINDIQEDSDET